MGADSPEPKRMEQDENECLQTALDQSFCCLAMQVGEASHENGRPPYLTLTLPEPITSPNKPTDHITYATKHTIMLLTGVVQDLNELIGARLCAAHCKRADVPRPVRVAGSHQVVIRMCRPFEPLLQVNSRAVDTGRQSYSVAQLKRS
jgi:hypothetical protein